tara:strand:+ start:2172 stop:3107 length:936 start_codon:yes stop_codon:yes gene_type:complete
MTSKKLERTLNLLAELLNSDIPKSASELKSRVGMYPDDLAAFRRTFDRDKNALRDMGVQLELTTVPGTNPPVEGYFINKSTYYLDDLNLTEEELTALNFAIASIKVLDGISEIEAMRKLGGYEGSVTSNVLKLEDYDVSNVAELFESISHRRKASFNYGGKSRNIEPWRLEFANGRWYLTGNSVQEEAVKTFRVDKVSELVLDEVFGSYEIPDHPPRVNLKPWSYGSQQAVETTIRIDSELLEWARTSLETPIQIEDNGSGVATISVSNKEAFFHRLTLLLDHAEIISPQEMRSQYLEYIGRYIEESNGET